MFFFLILEVLTCAREQPHPFLQHAQKEKNRHSTDLPQSIACVYKEYSTMSIEIEGHLFGQRRPPLSHYIKRILREYPQGQVFKVKFQTRLCT